MNCLCLYSTERIWSICAKCQVNPKVDTTIVPCLKNAYIHTLLARPHGAFQSQCYITIITNIVKNPNWQEADQLAIYKARPRI